MEANGGRKQGPHISMLARMALGAALWYFRVSLVAQMVKNLPAMWETQVQSLGREDPLEESMATHSSVLAGRIPWTEEPGGLQSVGLQSRTWLSN